MDGKKKNRRKRGNQNKVRDDAAPNAEAAVVPEQYHHTQILGNADGQSVGVSESDIEPERQKIYEARCINLQEEVRQLEDEKSLWLQKEACLEEKIRILQNEVNSCVQKEVILEEKLKDLQIGNDSSIQKQVILEDKVKHIEGIEDTWNLKEMSIKEMIARLDEVDVGLQMQVTELKESRDSLLQENQQFKESIPLLELRIQRFERESSFYGSSMVKIAEVNEVPIEPDQQDIAVEPSTELDHATAPFRAATPSDYASESGEKTPSMARIHETFNIHNGSEDFGANTRVDQGRLSELDGSRISEDVVSVPLDDVRVQDADPQALKNNEDPGVPLTDAPLIGAPFRLISYFAKYVSGADLVN